MQHTLTPAQAERLNRWPGNSYRADQVVTASIAGMSITTDSCDRVSGYVTLRLDDGAELHLVPRPWTEEL